MTVAIYAALLALVFVYLSIRTLLLRRRLKISIGTENSPEMLRATRVHSNFAEYTPIALVLAILMELSGAPSPLLHFVCATLLTGRLVHAYGVSSASENYLFRVLGMALTFTSLCTSALALLYWGVAPGE